MRHILSIVLLLIGIKLHAVIPLPAVVGRTDARQMGMGDIRSIDGSMGNRKLAFIYLLPYQLQALSLRGIALQLPVLGLDTEYNLMQSGDDFWSETGFRTMLSRQLGRGLYLGVCLCGLRIKTATNENGFGVFPEIQLRCRLGKTVETGLLLTNFTGSGVRILNQKETLSRAARLGFAFQPGTPIRLLAEAELETDQLPRLHTGADWRICKELSVRLGIITHPMVPAFGAGGCIGRFGYDLSGSLHPVLGLSSGASVSYNW